jgi:altronate hydrolase
VLNFSIEIPEWAKFGARRTMLWPFRRHIKPNKLAALGGRYMADALPFLLLDDRDNVLVVTRRISLGDPLKIDGQAIEAEKDFPLAHKLARRLIRAGETVVKYGAPIGVATADIPCGAHVHVHNMKSAYTPTYTLDAEKGDGT